jgi:crotonobetainyl-CoA:carnitine CoA-transferase CaiB-like acyl-CoA transferase
LYETLDGWLCVAAVTDAQWQSLCAAIGRPELVDDPGPTLASILEDAFASKSAAEWFEILDTGGVPCEVSSESWGQQWFDDPDVIANGWVTDYEHSIWGRLQQPGRFLDFSDTPTRIAGPPPVVGAHTREILLELGYDADEVTKLRREGAVAW